MPLSGLDIYKLLPKTNCRECGFATCLAFAMQLAKKASAVDKCPHISAQAKITLEESSLPPVRLAVVGAGEERLEMGNELVMFRHEGKFYNPCGIGFIVEDSLSDTEIKSRIALINNLKFERVGQVLRVNLVAIRQCSTAKRFEQAVGLVLAATNLPLALMSADAASLKQALELLKGKSPLIYHADKDNLAAFAALAKDYKACLAVSAPDPEGLAALTLELNKLGVQDIILEIADKPLQEKVWDLTQIRRQALKKNNRALGFPTLVRIERPDPYEEALEAATCICKYAGLVLIKGIEAWESLGLLTLRQNIYTDPQKPLQIEAKLYPVGQANDKSPVLVTTNFSLTYYTVLGEVEASKVPAFIATVDTEGMSVLTAWAAEKFTPEKIAKTLEKFNVSQTVAHKKVVIPGYVALMSGELEEASGWQVVVGPKEAAGLPTFLKNFQ